MFSVLLSVYLRDNPAFFDQSLASIFFQSTTAAQVVLIVDGPINKALDEVISKYKSFSEFEVFYLEKNLGLANALNFGLAKTKYKYVFRMDSDDICEYERFETQFSYMLQNSLDICSTYIYEFHDDLNKKNLKKLPLEHIDIKNSLPQSCPFNHPSVLYNKDIVLSIGGYHNIYLKEDMSLWIKLASITGVKMGNVPKPLLYMRVNSNTIRRRRGFKILHSELKLFNLHYKLNHQYYKYFYFILLIPIRLMPAVFLKFIYKMHRKHMNF